MVAYEAWCGDTVNLLAVAVMALGGNIMESSRRTYHA